MNEWTIERFAWQGEDALAVVGEGGTVRAAFALLGATLLSWRVRQDGDLLELTDGYRDPAELRAQSGVRNGVLAPFPNRIADARYSFGGQDHDLLPGVRGDRTIYHGFARAVRFAVADATPAADHARLVLRSNEIRPGRFDGYPFALDLTVAYTVEKDQITLEIHTTNAGDTPAPHAAGWHPYFRLGDHIRDIDELELRLPADTVIHTDRALIPAAGPDCRIDLNDLPEMDFRTGKPLGRRIIDACYADLRFGPGGRAHTALRDPDSGRELRIWQESGYTHIFTGDTLPRDRRRSIAIEPVEALTNAFNRDECVPALTVAPGETRRFRCGARFIAPANREDQARIPTP